MSARPCAGEGAGWPPIHGDLGVLWPLEGPQDSKISKATPVPDDLRRLIQIRPGDGVPVVVSIDVPAEYVD